MGVAYLVALYVFALRRAARGSGDIRRIAVEHGDPLGQNAIEKLLVPAHRFGIKRPEIAHRLYLVVSAPDRKTSVFTNTFYVEKHLFLHIGEKIRFIERIHHTGEHKVLPYHYAVAVAEVEQRVRRIVAAAPDAYHIEVRFRRRADVMFQLRGVGAGVETVEGDEVRSFAEHPFAVDYETEIAAVRVRASVELYLSQPNLLLCADTVVPFSSRRTLHS